MPKKKTGNGWAGPDGRYFFGVGENPFLSPDLPLLMACVINILSPNFSVQHFYRVLFLKPINYGKSRFRPGVDVGIIKARYRPKSRIRFIFRWEIKRFFRNIKVEHLLLTIFFVCGSSLTCCLLLCAGKMGKWEESPHTEHSPLSLLEKYSSNIGGGGEEFSCYNMSVRAEAKARIPQLCFCFLLLQQIATTHISPHIFKMRSSNSFLSPYRKSKRGK